MFLPVGSPGNLPACEHDEVEVIDIEGIAFSLSRGLHLSEPELSIDGRPANAAILISLKLDGQASQVMVKEYQLDPVTHQLLHADFYQLAMDRAITVTAEKQVFPPSWATSLASKHTFDVGADALHHRLTQYVHHRRAYEIFLGFDAH